VKFFLYTMAGSVLMLAAIIYLYNRAQTFDYAGILEMLLASGRLIFADRGRAMLLVSGLLRGVRHQGAAFPATHPRLPRCGIVEAAHRRLG